MVPTRQLGAVNGGRSTVVCSRAALRATRIHAANAIQRPHRAGVIVRFKPDTQQSKDSGERSAQDVAEAPGTPPSSQPPAVPEPEASTAVPVVFSLQKRCEFGDAYAIVGATPELGGWDTNAALALQWHEGDVWEASAPLPVATAVSFKYIRTHNGECVEWSSGSDFQVTVSSKGSASPGLMTEAYTVQLEGGSEDSGLKVALATDAQAAATTAAALSELETNAAALSALSPQQQQEGQQGQTIKASDLPQGNVNEQSMGQGGGAFEQKEGVSEALQEALEPQLVDTGAEASPVKGSTAIITEGEQQEGQQGQTIKASDLPQGNVNEQSTGQGGGAFEQKEGVSEALQEALEPQLVDTGVEASPVKGSSAIITEDAQQQGEQQGQTIKASDLPQGNVNEQSTGQGGGAFEQKEGVSEALQEALEPQLVDTGVEASPVKGSSAIITEDTQQQGKQQGQTIKASDLPQGNVNEQSTGQGGGAFEQKEGVSEALQEALEPQLVDTGAEASPVKGSSAIITEDAQQQGKQQGQTIKASDLPQGNVNEQSTGQGGGAFEQKEGVSEALQKALEPQLVDTGAEASPAKGSSAIITEGRQQEGQQGQTIKASDLPQGNVNEQSTGQGGGAFEQKEGVSEALQEALEPQLVDTGAEASPVKGSSAIITEGTQQQAPAAAPEHTDASATGGTPASNSLVTDAIPAPAGTKWAEGDSATDTPTATDTSASETATAKQVATPDTAPQGHPSDTDGKASTHRVAAAAMGNEPPKAAQDAAAAVLPGLLKGGGALKDAAGQLLSATPQEPEPEADTTPAETANAVLGGVDKDKSAVDAVSAMSGGGDKGDSAAVAANAVAGGPELEDAQDRQGALAPAKDAVSENAREAMVQKPAKAELGTNMAAPAETTAAKVDVGPGQPAWPAVEEGLDEDVAEEPQGQPATKSVEEAESKVAAAAKGQATKAKGAAGPLSLLYLVGGWLLGK